MVFQAFKLNCDKGDDFAIVKVLLVIISNKMAMNLIICGPVLKGTLFLMKLL